MSQPCNVRDEQTLLAELTPDTALLRGFPILAWEVDSSRFSGDVCGCHAGIPYLVPG